MTDIVAIEARLSGIVLDEPPISLPPDVYSNGRNMRSTGMGMRRVDGVRQYLSNVGGGLLFVPKFVMLAIRNNVTYVLYAGDGGVAVCDASAHYDITPSSGWTSFAAGTMVGTTYNGFAVFAAPGRAPWYWDGTLAVGGVKPLPGFIAGGYGNTIAAFNQHIFSGSITVATTLNERLAWSDVAAAGAVPSTWTPSATNQAGELLLSSGYGPILTMLPLAQQLMVYRVVGMFAVQYVGRPYIYVARRLTAEAGAVSRNAAVEVLGQHAVLSSGDILLTNGSAVRSIGDGRVKRSLFSQVSQAGLALAHAYSVPGTSEVVFALPIGNDTKCNTAYVWDYARDKWSVRDLPDTVCTVVGQTPESLTLTTWASDAGTWDADFLSWDATPQGGFLTRAISASPSRSSLYVLDSGDTTADAGNVVGTLERIGMVIGDGASVKQAVRVHPRITAANGTVISIQIGAQLDAGDPVTWGPVQTYTVGSGKPVDTQAKGRLFSIRLTGNGAATWHVAGFGFEFEKQGRQ